MFQSTYKQSLLATGSSIELVKAICENEIQNGIAFVRYNIYHILIILVNYI